MVLFGQFDITLVFFFTFLHFAILYSWNAIRSLVEDTLVLFVCWDSSLDTALGGMMVFLVIIFSDPRYDPDLVVIVNL